MHWGHTISDKGGAREVTRAEYNRAFGAKVPPKPEVDECIQYIWAMWWRLNARRPPSQGVAPIPFHEIESFSRLAQEPVSPDDLRMLEALDNAFLRAVSEEQKAAIERRQEEQKRKPKR